MPIIKTTISILAMLAILACSVVAAVAQRGSSLRGQVTDQLGAVIIGASVTLIAQNGKEQITQTDDRGAYHFNGLVPERTACEPRRAALRPTTNRA